VDPASQPAGDGRSIDRSIHLGDRSTIILIVVVRGLTSLRCGLWWQGCLLLLTSSSSMSVAIDRPWLELSLYRCRHIHGGGRLREEAGDRLMLMMMMMIDRR
jgi:hypothetical protein